MKRPDIFGYFDSPVQSTPAHDPGPSAPCPVCGHEVGRHGLDNPLKTISVCPEDPSHRTRSFFFRVHRNCWSNATQHEKTLIEGSVIDEHIEVKGEEQP